MRRAQRLLPALLLAALPAQAAIVFTPHVSEYATLPRGEYLDTTLIHTSISSIRNGDGEREQLAVTAVPPGETIDASLLLARYLWIGNFFEDTRLPFFPEHDQFLRVIGVAGTEKASGAINDLSRVFGQSSSGSGIGDLFLLAGFYGEKYHWGPLKGNGLYAVTVKAPIGEYDRNALLNVGTHYWSVIPQIGHHQEWFGKLFVDATAAYQSNSPNHSPAYGGLTPSKPADVYNLEANVAWKFTQHWFLDAGFSYFHSVGSNHYDQVTLNFANQPVPATTACNSLMIPTSQCTITRQFYLAPVPGRYKDRGVSDSLLTLGLTYIYRASSVVSLRAALPVAGRGAQFDVPYYVCNRQPCNAGNEVTGARQTAHLRGVQEAAAVSASPYYELRFVFLLFAP
ncbi:MAG: hypothetical protein NVS9B10_16860 [Nevskia sp.]